MHDPHANHLIQPLNQWKQYPLHLMPFYLEIHVPPHHSPMHKYYADSHGNCKMKVLHDDP